MQSLGFTQGPNSSRIGVPRQRNDPGASPANVELKRGFDVLKMQDVINK